MFLVFLISALSFFNGINYFNCDYFLNVLMRSLMRLFDSRNKNIFCHPTFRLLALSGVGKDIQCAALSTVLRHLKILGN